MVFGVFSLINYIFPYFMWSSSGSATSTAARFIGGSLSFILLMKEYWPKNLRRYLSHYWFFTLLYCLPFLTTYTLLENQGTYNWIVTASLVVLLLSVLVDWLNFAIILALGVLLGVAFYVFINGSITLHFNNTTLIWICYMYAFSTIIGLLFSRRRERLQEERIKAMKFMGGAIAHELRTPLAAIDMNCQLILENSQFTDKGVRTIKRIAENSQAIIDNLLTKMTDQKQLTIQTLDLNDLVQKALSHYPYNKKGLEAFETHLSTQALWIKVDEYLFIHVILNLIKNALESIERAQKGSLSLHTYERGGAIFLAVKDTGEGVSPHQKNRLFKEFFSTRKGGSGLGLFFVKNVLTKMNMTIDVASEEGEFTIMTIKCGKVRHA